MTCSFDEKVRGHRGFCGGCDWIWVFQCLRFLVLGLRWCVTGFLPTSWSHEEPYVGFENFDLIDIYVTVYYSANFQPLLISIFFFLLILYVSPFVFFYFYFDTNVLYCTCTNEIIFFLISVNYWNCI